MALGTERPPGRQLKGPPPVEAWPTSQKGFLLPFSLARQVPLFLPGGTRRDLDSASNLSSFSAPICPHTPLHSTAAPSRAARCSSQARKPGCSRASELLHVSPTPASSTSFSCDTLLSWSSRCSGAVVGGRHVGGEPCCSSPPAG